MANAGRVRVVDRRGPPSRLRAGAVVGLALLILACSAKGSAAQSGVGRVAHPRGIRSFIGVYQESDAPLETRLVRMGLGDALPLARGRAGETAWYEVALAAGVQAEFDLAVSSFDFLAADFLVGIPVSVGWRDWSGLFRLYHQSSHLGDDILARDDVVLPELDAYDFEALEGFLGRRLGGVRPYAGGELRFRRTPGDQATGVFHVGLETVGDRGDPSPGIRPVGGLHLTLSDDTDGPALSGRFGMDWIRGEGAFWRRPTRIQLEFLHGTGIAGRFFRLRRTTVGLSIQIGR